MECNIVNDLRDLADAMRESLPSWSNDDTSQVNEAADMLEHVAMLAKQLYEACKMLVAWSDSFASTSEEFFECVEAAKVAVRQYESEPNVPGGTT